MSSETCTKPGPATCVSDSRIARSIPIRSMSLIVYALIPSSRIRSRSRAVDRAQADERDAVADRRAGSVQRSLSKRPSVSPIAAASGIPCTLPLGEVSGVFRSPCASIQSTPPTPVRAREAAERAERDRVVAAEHERHRALLERPADEPRDLAARPP